MTPPRLFGTRGFALLEVILASAIFAMAGLGFALALDRLCKTDVEAERLDAIRATIDSGLDEARIEPAESRRRTETLDGVSYVREEAPFSLQDDDHNSRTGFWKITITAQWKEGALSREEHGQIYVYRP